MNARHGRYLKEMGLGPLWHLRTPTPVNAAAPEQVPKQVPESTPCAADNRCALPQAMEWDALQSAIRSCKACPLYTGRTQAVPGVGDQNAAWLFVGEAPGADEDAQGEPFVGGAGKLLDNMLRSINLKRGDNVYIANVLKCHPPGNRNPLPEEIALCEPYLKRQIDLINPKLIVALGKFAAQTLSRSETSISDLRGHIHRYRDIPLIVTYHPAYLLRHPQEKAKAWRDLCLAVKTMQAL